MQSAISNTQSWFIVQLYNSKLIQNILQGVIYILYIQYSNHNEAGVQQGINSANVL